MTEESSTTSYLSVAMTTDTDGNTITSSLSNGTGTDLYFHCALVVIGVVVTATNALILYALVASKQHKKHVLIVNQNALDFFTSFVMVLTHSVKLCNIQLTGSAGYWLCMLLLSDSLIFCGTIASVINLASVTIERYLKVVHPAWSSKPRNWMLYFAVTLSWIGSFVYNKVVVFSSTAVIDGACYSYVIWENDEAAITEFMITFIAFYAVIIIIFIFCYRRILVVIRRQAKVMAGHAAARTSAAQTQSNQIESSVTKTMIFVSALFAVSYLPINVYGLIARLNPNPVAADDVYYLATIFAYLYMCTNPFVYATKFGPVKQVLLRLIFCKKTLE